MTYVFWATAAVGAAILVFWAVSSFRDAQDDGEDCELCGLTSEAPEGARSEVWMAGVPAPHYSPESIEEIRASLEEGEGEWAWIRLFPLGGSEPARALVRKTDVGPVFPVV